MKPLSLIKEQTLRRLISRWEKREHEFNKASLFERNVSDGDLNASRRYEGEAIATRWCYEDLKRLLDAFNDKS